MSLRLEMLQVARLAPKMLGESAPLVRGFLGSQISESGAFRDRDGKADLYYTVFGIDSLLALDPACNLHRQRSYIESIADVAPLDFVHLCCLIRARAQLSLPPLDAANQRLLNFRLKCGGFAQSPNGDNSVYNCFLGLGAHQDAGLAMTRSEDFLRSLQDFQTPSGGWNNQREMGEGSTNATAAAVAIYRQLGAEMSAETARWLHAQQHSSGGFKAAPGAPLPDLLSTATALHALSGLGYPMDQIIEPTLDFLDSLWTAEGSFYAHWAEEVLDVEYTFYALLALGHLCN